MSARRGRHDDAILSIGIAFLSIPASRYFYLSRIPISSFLDRMHRRETAGGGG